jgi:hypothetical protein
MVTFFGSQLPVDLGAAYKEMTGASKIEHRWNKQNNNVFV